MTQASRRTMIGAMLAAAAVPLCAMTSFAQCAMCRASLLSSRDAAALIEGLRQGIVLLLAIPLLIVAIVWTRLKRASGQAGQPTARQSIQDGKSYLLGRAASD